MNHVRRCTGGVIAFIAVAILPSVHAAASNGGSGASGSNGIRLSLGAGGGARSVAGNVQELFATELTLTMVPMVSLSTGMTAGEGGVEYAYGEIAFHLVASLGFGFGYGAYQANGRRREGMAGHVFIGLPIPLTREPTELVEEGKHFFYLLPYYRPSWGAWPGAAHELGVMLKFSYGLRGFSGWFGG